MADLGAEARLELPANISDVCDLGVLALRLARIQRATAIGPDGVLETDTDHTVMVQLIAMALAQHEPEINDRDVLVQSLAHDMVEVESDDTQTFNPTEKLLRDKKAREAAGKARITERFGVPFPWLIQAMSDYEAGKTRASSLVHIADKITRSICHLNDGGASLSARGMTVEEHDRNVGRTYEIMKIHMERVPNAASIWREMNDQVREIILANTEQ